MSKRSSSEERLFQSLRKKYLLGEKQNTMPTPDSSSGSTRNISEELLNSKGTELISPNSPSKICEESDIQTMNLPDIDHDHMVAQVVDLADAVLDDSSLGDLNKQESQDEETLDSDYLEILGEDPTLGKKYGEKIQKDLAVRLQHLALSGLPEQESKELIEKYLIPVNAQLIDAPELNPEFKIPSFLSAHLIKRDKAICHRQKQMAAAIASLSEAITSIFSSKDKDLKMLKLLMDTVRNLCDLQYGDSMVRRNYILSTVKKDVKNEIKNIKIGSKLFEKLPDILSAEAIRTKVANTKHDTPKAPPPIIKPLNNINNPLNPTFLNPAFDQMGAPGVNQFHPKHPQINQPTSSFKKFHPQQHQGHQQQHFNPKGHNPIHKMGFNNMNQYHPKMNQPCSTKKYRPPNLQHQGQRQVPFNPTGPNPGHKQMEGHRTNQHQPADSEMDQPASSWKKRPQNQKHRHHPYSMPHWS